MPVPNAEHIRLHLGDFYLAINKSNVGRCSVTVSSVHVNFNVQLLCERQMQSREHIQIKRIRISYVTAKSVINTAYVSANCDYIQKSVTQCSASNT